MPILLRTMLPQFIEPQDATLPLGRNDNATPCESVDCGDRFGISAQRPARDGLNGRDHGQNRQTEVEGDILFGLQRRISQLQQESDAESQSESTHETTQGEKRTVGGKGLIWQVCWI